MEDAIVIPKREIDILMTKLEDKTQPYYERVGRAQGTIERWTFTLPTVKVIGGKTDN